MPTARCWQRWCLHTARPSRIRIYVRNSSSVRFTCMSPAFAVNRAPPSGPALESRYATCVVSTAARLSASAARHPCCLRGSGTGGRLSGDSVSWACGGAVRGMAHASSHTPWACNHWMLCWHASRTPLVCHAAGWAVTFGGHRSTAPRKAVCALSAVDCTPHPPCERGWRISAIVLSFQPSPIMAPSTSATRVSNASARGPRVANGRTQMS